ncbi:MAG: DUF1501 domain-containing protein [Acidobacteria bacterium]|nr:DUF1501 domain-containing protein [Acidobacteriota bacterium]MDA1234339.1 DUF1501 domain-containing protein [Acidobacteriota bacterium]
MRRPNFSIPPTRREIIARSMGGLGSVLLGHMLHENPLLASDGRTPFDLLPRQPHFAPKAKSVIFLFMPGGPSQMDLLDPKPYLDSHDGQAPPTAVVSRRDVDKPKLMASPFKFKQHGQSGIPVSDLLPGLSTVVDELAVIRSGVTERIDHDTAQYHYTTGRNASSFPSIGSWVAYGLGTENSNMPGYVALKDGDALIGARAWTSGWLPPTYAGTLMELERVPIPDLQRPESLSEMDERSVIDMVKGLNQLSRDQHPELLELDTRIANYELAARMQVAAMDLVDFSQESEDTKKLYGMDNEVTEKFGRRCLLARRLVEGGVRFVQITKQGWDHHSNIVPLITKSMAQTDIPIAGLIKDLKQRGLLDSTLIVWGGEFGRLPTTEGGTGRDHNPKGFSVWMAGGGIKGGTIYGATDDIGYEAVENPVSHSDMHATILHLMGIDVRKLTYDYDGRVETLIGVNPARVLKEIIA